MTMAMPTGKSREDAVAIFALIAASLLGTGCGNQGPANSDESERPTAGDPEFANLIPKLTDAERETFERFLNKVSCTSVGCSVEDMAFENRSAVVNYFVSHVAGEQKKGLVVGSSQVWPGTISVCWTADSNATLAEKQSVIANVEATWKQYANISFGWYSAGTTPRSCTEATAPNFNVKIWQHTSQTRGCSTVGKNNQSGIACSGSVAHSYANMLLGAGDPIGDPKTAVHEFGHAIGIYHEQDRVDSACTEGVSPVEPGSHHIDNYDANSIMNYCAPKPAPNLSSGDTVSVAYLYGGRPVNPTFRIRSWLPTAVLFTARRADDVLTSVVRTGVSNIPVDVPLGATQTGAVMTLTPGQPRLRCSVLGLPTRVGDDVLDVLSTNSSPLPAECYSPSAIAGALL